MCSQWSWCSPESNSAHHRVGSWCLHGWVTPQAPLAGLTEGLHCIKSLRYSAFRQAPTRTDVFLYSWTDFHPRQHWLFSRVNGWVQTMGKISAMDSKWKKKKIHAKNSKNLVFFIGQVFILLYPTYNMKKGQKFPQATHFLCWILIWF